METEYIKRKDVIETICNLCRIENDDCSYPRCTIINTVKSIQAADVVERKHGKLLTNEFGYESCSVCHYGLMLFITDENNTLKKPNYCPNCGAYMRESEGE